MAGMMRVPRSRGALSGLLLLLLGAWGALMPFLGPYWHYGYAPDSTWHYTTGRLLLEILPGAGAFLGGLLVLGSANRLSAMLGGWLAALSGAWFVLGMALSSVWGSATVGAPLGGTTRQAWEYVGLFGGLGSAIVLVAAFALGRFTVIGAREAAWAAARSNAGDEVDADWAAATPATTTIDQPAYARDGAHAASDGDGHHLHWPGSRRHAGVR